MRRLVFLLGIVFFSNGYVYASVNVNNLVDDVCDLLLLGHSVDKVVAMIGDSKEYNCDIKKLVTHIQDLLNKKQSKEEVMKESEKFYARENFWAKGKATSFVLKTIAILVAVYMVYRFFSWRIKIPKIPIPWVKQKKQSSRVLLHEQEVQERHLAIPSCPGDVTENQPKSIEQVKQEAQKICRISGSERGYFAYNLELAIDELVAYGKNIGLKADLTQQYDDFKLSSESRGDLRLDELISSLVEYEKKLGLGPVTVPH